MGSFFTSPREEASQNLYDAAVSGRPIGERFLRNTADLDKQRLRAQTSERVSNLSGDILSRLSSMGVSPGASTEATIARGVSPILAGEQNAEVGIDSAVQQALSNMLLQELGLGLSGLSSSSTFGNMLAGIQTLTNIASGVQSLIPTGTKSIASPASDNLSGNQRLKYLT